MNGSELDRFIATPDIYKAILSDCLTAFSKDLNGKLKRRHSDTLSSDVFERLNRLVSEAKDLAEDLDPPIG